MVKITCCAAFLVIFKLLTSHGTWLDSAELECFIIIQSILVILYFFYFLDSTIQWYCCSNCHLQLCIARTNSPTKFKQLYSPPQSISYQQDGDHDCRRGQGRRSHIIKETKLVFTDTCTCSIVSLIRDPFYGSLAFSRLYPTGLVFNNHVKHDRVHDPCPAATSGVQAEFGGNDGNNSASGALR